MSINYENAARLLKEVFATAEQDLLRGATPEIPEDLKQPFEVMFRSATQAYREALAGCVIARLQDKGIDIRLPYVKHGSSSYNGRTLDEKVVNPFLQGNRIPCSRGPFLSTFRRGIRFSEDTKEGLRDLEGYDAFLSLIGYLETTEDDQALIQFLRYLLYCFAALREAAIVPLTKLQRISLEQYGSLISGLLDTPSGGRFPVLLIVAALYTIRDFFSLDWVVEHQGINVADAAAGVGGDITVSRGGSVVFAAEVTERPLDRDRVVATFNTKIAPNGIEDYLFFVPIPQLSDAARAQARQYFAQGHEVNFLGVRDWVIMSLATMGARGRSFFNQHLMRLLDAADVPKSVKMGWNNQVNQLLAATNS
ncbi:MAG: restriction endonuclease, SacI family [Thermoguttaceae bacterium]